MRRSATSFRSTPARARGNDELSFHGGSPEIFGSLFQDALRSPSLWQRWRQIRNPIPMRSIPRSARAMRLPS